MVKELSLTPLNARKLMKGLPTVIKAEHLKGTGVKVFVHPSKHKKMARAMTKGKGYTLSLDKDELDASTEGGKIDFKKVMKTGLKAVAKPLVKQAVSPLGVVGSVIPTNKLVDVAVEKVVGRGKSSKKKGLPKALQLSGLDAEEKGGKIDFKKLGQDIKKGYAKDGKLTDKERSIAYATAWKQHNKEKNESKESGEDMTKLTEGEVQQASAIVTAKTMVDRVSRWIEELSGMENDTLLQLGDSIRDEMSQEQAKTFISSVAPAIQQALENLKSTRETLATGVRMLTGEEQGAEMLGAEPTAPEGGEEMPAAEPDMMNAEPEAGAEDEFAAAEPAAGGVETAGREQRESIQYQNSLLKVLAG